METFTQILEYLVHALNAFSVLVLVWGSILCLIHFLKDEFSRQKAVTVAKALIEVKNVLGVYILLSLEILIAADIIETILNPSWQDLARLGTIVAIRTVCAYFLNKEIREIHNEVSSEEEIPVKVPATRSARHRGD